MAQADADVLDGVVLVHLQVAGGLELQVEVAVGREQVQHVVQEGDAGIDLDAAAAVQFQFQVDLGFPGFAVDFA